MGGMTRMTLRNSYLFSTGGFKIKSLLHRRERKLDRRNVKVLIVVKTVPIFKHHDKNSSLPTYATITSNPSDYRTLTPNTSITFYKATNRPGKTKGSRKQAAAKDIIQPNFQDMAIGGLDREFRGIFHQAFGCQPGTQNRKGTPLPGPPGTGKTPTARQIDKMLKAKEPKDLNDPEILNGNEEARGRLRRESPAPGGIFEVTFVRRVLLTRVLFGARTVSKYTLRFPPDKFGRKQIPKIHTNRANENQLMDYDVDIRGLAAKTKNILEAEIAGSVKRASSFAFNRQVKVISKHQRCHRSDSSATNLTRYFLSSEVGEMPMQSALLAGKRPIRYSFVSIVFGSSASSIIQLPHHAPSIRREKDRPGRFSPVTCALAWPQNRFLQLLNVKASPSLYPFV
ncbi:unnamed protein product [Tuber aestivum]|uniref:Vesicular-fusion protein SEC18 n=1 Tax=Tuber aestivum TaxID=59557 RepID=A0A292Q7C3_9PEZI|nr:unnamed protein product [Tuber aestivum]